MRPAIAFTLSILIGFVLVNFKAPNLPEPSMTGYTYSAATGRAEVNIDQFMAECKGSTTVITVSPDRDAADLKCRVGITDMLLTVRLPISKNNTQQFAVVWPR